MSFFCFSRILCVKQRVYIAGFGDGMQRPARTQYTLFLSSFREGSLFLPTWWPRPVTIKRISTGPSVVAVVLLYWPFPRSPPWTLILDSRNYYYYCYYNHRRNPLLLSAPFCFSNVYVRPRVCIILCTCVSR